MAFDTSAKIIPQIIVGGRPFLPTIEFGGASVGVTYALQEGFVHYIAPGLMWISVRMTLSSKGSSTGVCQVRIPTTDTSGAAIGSFSHSVSASLYTEALLASSDQFSARFIPSSRVVHLVKRSATTQGQMSEADIDNTSQIIFQSIFPYTL